MQIARSYTFFLLVSWFSLIHALQGLEPAPAPSSGIDVETVPVPGLSPVSPPSRASSAPSMAPEADIQGEADVSPASAPEGGESEESAEIPASPTPPQETETATVKWCSVRGEIADCHHYVSLLKEIDGYVWKCVQRDTIEECLSSIKHGEADLINLDPGLAYIAFVNYSMKAIANEVYCNQAESYSAVAIVNRKSCKKNPQVSLQDFEGRRSCHGGYLTATGWNYPVNYLKQFIDSKQTNGHEIVSRFFSAACAPSEFEGMGECSGCKKENGTCPSRSLYSSHSGAFRCLVEELGDIAFVKEDTALLYSMEGPYNQTWSRKSINEFMYLCPQGGCREINGYPGDCIFGTVPANVIMVPNSISSKKKSVVLQTLLNATWANALYSGRNGDSHLLSSRALAFYHRTIEGIPEQEVQSPWILNLIPIYMLRSLQRKFISKGSSMALLDLEQDEIHLDTSTQRINAVKQLTRSYLGMSASISQTIQNLNSKKAQATTLSTVPVTSSTTLLYVRQPWIVAAVLILLLLTVIFPI